MNKGGVNMVSSKAYNEHRTQKHITGCKPKSP